MERRMMSGERRRARPRIQAQPCSAKAYRKIPVQSRCPRVLCTALLCRRLITSGKPLKTDTLTFMCGLALRRLTVKSPFKAFYSRCLKQKTIPLRFFALRGGGADGLCDIWTLRTRNRKKGHNIRKMSFSLALRFFSAAFVHFFKGPQQPSRRTGGNQTQNLIRYAVVFLQQAPYPRGADGECRPHSSVEARRIPRHTQEAGGASFHCIAA